MKAATYSQYGPPENLRIEEVAKPSPGPGQALIRVRASSLNSWDIDLLRGTPWFARMESWSKPAHPILGADIAGTVEAVGEGVTKFRPGDDVFGDLSDGGWGGLAEYVAAPVDKLILKPAELSFASAAATPQAALLALQALRLNGPLRPGQRVLINGAGGGMGTFAIQLAKLSGAEVTAVDHGSKLDALRGLGAHHVIDYAVTDFTATGERYDLIVDAVASRSLLAYGRCLTPTGCLAVVGGRTGSLLQAGLLGLLVSRPSGRKFRILLYNNNPADLEEVAAMPLAGKLAPVIDGIYPLAETAAAFRRIGSGLHIGKIVVTP
jgi:NADPH:quinone reductase-like Zn-dependent oxidoreductase